MAILIDKITKEKSTGDTNDAKASGKYWVFSNPSDPLLSIDLTYYRDVDGVPVEMTAEEKTIVDQTELATAQTAKVITVGDKAKAEIKGMVYQDLVQAQMFLSSQTDSTTEIFTAEEKALLKVSIETAWAKWLQKKAAIMMANTVEEVEAISW